VNIRDVLGHRSHFGRKRGTEIHNRTTVNFMYGRRSTEISVVGNSVQIQRNIEYIHNSKGHTYVERLNKRRRD